MTEISKNPWLGLKAYSEKETLYGRDEEIRSLSQYVMYDRETVLYGRSAIGKSSIINAGVIPVARRNDVTPVYIRLEHNATADSFIEQIRKAIADVGVIIDNVYPVHDPNGELLWELFHGNRFIDSEGKRVKLLIIFDQFEEIFTLQRAERVKRKFFDQLADLFNDVKPDVLETSINVVAQNTLPEDKPAPTKESNNILDINIDDLDIELPSEDNNYVDDNEYHIVFTLREDFLSDFEYYTAKIPPLKNHRFGLRPINEEQAADIICKPRIGLVSREVAKLVIEKVTGRSDFNLDGTPEIEVNSAMLSLYMSRLYEKKQGDTITAELVEEKGGEIIQDFYTDSTQTIPEEVMERIEDELTNEEGRRENKSYGILCNIVGKNYVDQLIDSQLLNRFQYAGDNRVEFMHDILCPIISQRKNQRAENRRQEEERRQQEEANRQLMAEKEQLAKQARLSRQRNRRIIGSSAAIVFILAMIIGYFYFTTMHEYSAYHAQFKRIYGWPVGIGNKLTEGERKTAPLYYRLSRTGLGETTFTGRVARLAKIIVGKGVGTFTDVEVMSSNPQLPLIPHVSSPEVDGNNADDQHDEAAMAYYEKLKRIKTIHFVGNENGATIDKEIVRDEEGKVLFVTSYFHLQTATTEDKTSGSKEAWLHFLTPQGQAMKIRDNGVNRMKIAWDSKGRLTSMMYYDDLLACRSITDGVYGNVMRYCKDETMVRYFVDEYGQPVKEGLTYNALATRVTNEGQRTSMVYARELSIPDTISMMTLREVFTTPAAGPQGFTRMVRTTQCDSLYIGSECVAIRTYQRDDCGNVTLITTSSTGVEGSVDFFANHSPYQTHCDYDPKTGYQILSERTNKEGQPFTTSTDSIYKRTWSYDSRGALATEKRYTAHRCVYSYEKTMADNVTTEIIDDLVSGTYSMIVDTLQDNGARTTAYYGRNNQPAFHYEYDEDIYSTIYFHRIKREPMSECVTRTYLYGINEADELKYYSKECTTDADGHTLSYRTFDKEGSILTSMMYFFQDGQYIARAAMGVDGTPVRCPNWEADGASYYKLYHSTDANKNFTNIRPVNEFNEVSAFLLRDDYLSVKYLSLKGVSVTTASGDKFVIDSYGQMTFCKANGISTMSIPYLHILSKENCRLYEKGLRDGDRIVELGQWRWGNSDAILLQEWFKMRTSKETKVTVLRPEGLSFTTITITVTLDGHDADEYHILRLTDDEYKQLRKYLKS